MSRRTIQAAALALILGLAGAASAAELLQVEPFIPATMSEAGTVYPVRGQTRVQVIPDRVEYLHDDLNGQFLVTFLGVANPEGDATQKIALSLKDASGKEIASKTVAPVKSPKLPLLIPVSELKAGRYTLAAALLDKDGRTVKDASVNFAVSDRQEPHVAFPKDGVPINVHLQNLVPDATWPISTGVPMPNATFRDISGFALLENGKPVPAQFSLRGTWSPNGYVKWVGVDFVAKYDNGKPREYRLVQDPAARVAPARPLSVKESPERIVVDTGAIRFEIGRKPFAGIEKLWVSRAGEGMYSENEPLVNGPGGPFLVDDQGTRFDSIHARDVQVVVEESGPVSALIAAKGWYYNDTGMRLCKFAIRFKVFAGQPYVTISHRMINTIFDQYYKTRLADVGFETVLNGRVEKWLYGFDGKSQGGEGGSEPASIYLHQDRDEHFRLMKDDTTLTEGKRSDGWMHATTARGSMAYFLRDIWEKFPKEMEVETGADSPKLVCHFWPKHGHQAFTEAEELPYAEIYKARFAEEGKLLNMTLPEAYYQKMVEYNKADWWDSGHDLNHLVMDISGAPKNHAKIQNEGGMGTVIGGELTIGFFPKPEETANLAARAALVQLSPHGVADPVWNCATQVLGPVAPRDPAKFGPAEKLMDVAYVAYRRAVIDRGDEYGMWTYGDVHEMWMPEKDCANLYRVWQHDHYQNVFQAWLLYFRSGMLNAFEWARIHSNNHLDVGVNNYFAYPPRIHAYSGLGDMGGQLHHWGVLPWSGNMGDAHWLDIADYFLQYDLTGDRRGLDLAEKWCHTRGLFGFPERPVVPANLDAWRSDAKMAEMAKYEKAHPHMKADEVPQWIKDERAKLEPYSTRDVFVPLGAWVQYYEGTWNSQALLYIDGLAEYLNPPAEVAGGGEQLITFGKHWQDWYFELTRDPRVVTYVKGMFTNDLRTEKYPWYFSIAAFIYHATGDKTYIAALESRLYDLTLNVYDCPGDIEDGYSEAIGNPGAMLLGRLPYFLHALDAAGIKFQHTFAATSLPSRFGQGIMGDKYLSLPRGWSNAGLTVLCVAPKPTKLAISINAPLNFGDLDGSYQLFYGLPEINAFSRPGTPRAVEQQIADKQKASLIRFTTKNLCDSPPEFRRVSSNLGDGEPQQWFPYIERPNNDPSKLEYHLEYDGMEINLPVFLDAETEKPLPQVAVIARQTFWDHKAALPASHIKGVMGAWFRPLDPKAVINLTFKSAHMRYWEPSTIRISDATGNVILDSSVFMCGERKEVAVKLDPAVNPLPWEILVASSGDNSLTFTGAEELFFALDPADFDAVLPKIPVYKKP